MVEEVKTEKAGVGRSPTEATSSAVDRVALWRSVARLRRSPASTTRCRRRPCRRVDLRWCGAVHGSQSSVRGLGGLAALQASESDRFFTCSKRRRVGSSRMPTTSLSQAVMYQWVFQLFESARFGQLTQVRNKIFDVLSWLLYALVKHVSYVHFT